MKLLLTLVEIISETVNERRKGGKLGLMVQNSRFFGVNVILNLSSDKIKQVSGVRVNTGLEVIFSVHLQSFASKVFFH